MQQLHVFISGQVQGVGFRQFVKYQARKLGINGWVKNTDDGRVEAIFQAEENVLREMVDICKKGPQLALVTDISQEKMHMRSAMQEFTIY